MASQMKKWALSGFNILSVILDEQRHGRPLKLIYQTLNTMATDCLLWMDISLTLILSL